MLDGRLKPFRLLPIFDPRPWGRRDLRPWFPPAPEPIGEIWYHQRNLTAGGPTLDELIRRHGQALLGSAVNTPIFPILTKLIFTAEKLSIQVHPDDEYARQHEQQWGKIEMWYVLEAEPGARLALGLKEKLEPQRFRQAALSGEIEELVNWIDIRPGDVFVIYPGTIHALGAGVVLAEIQQNSDLTYRIYDYQRPRPLHLDKAAEVAVLGPYPGCPGPVTLGGGWKRLAETPYFVTEVLETEEASEYRPEPERFHMLLFLSGAGRLAGQHFQAGQCWLVPAQAVPFRIEPEQPLRLLRARYPRRP